MAAIESLGVELDALNAEKQVTIHACMYMYLCLHGYVFMFVFRFALYTFQCLRVYVLMFALCMFHCLHLYVFMFALYGLQCLHLYVFMFALYGLQCLHVYVVVLASYMVQCLHVYVNVFACTYMHACLCACAHGGTLRGAVRVSLRTCELMIACPYMCYCLGQAWPCVRVDTNSSRDYHFLYSWRS